MLFTAPRIYDHIAVVIPAHNEQAHLPVCLRAVLTACLYAPVAVTVVVVLDSSEDSTADLTGRYGSDVHFVRVKARNVGAARAVGFGYARSLRGLDNAKGWYATTDADSVVDPDWLIRQLKWGADMVLGLVRVTDWRGHRPGVVQRYLQEYNSRIGTTHDHIHGANMGFSSHAYWRVGGFRALTSDEDTDLVARFEANGYLLQRDTRRSVSTSARTQARAPHGFAQHLRQLTASTVGDCP